MSSELTEAHKRISMKSGRRQPNFEILAASDRQPGGDNKIPMAQRKTIITMDKSNCRWPIGDPKRDDFHLCGAATNGDDSYCPDHMQIAHVPSGNPKRAA